MLDQLTDLLPRFAERERADPEAYPSASIADLHAAGIIRAPFAKESGGSGATAEQAVDAIEALAAVSASTALIASMPIGLAGVYASASALVTDVHRTAFSEQLARVAAAYGAGHLYAACNSEKGAGGSLDAIKTAAAPIVGGSFVLTGEKILASGGTNAATFFSTARVPEGAIPGAAAVEFFLADAHAAGVTILADWDGFGMRSTESQTVRYEATPAELMGFPNFIATVQPTHYWFLLFAAIPLGCAAAILRALASPAPTSPALRLRYSEATMRYEAMRAYLRETARDWQPGSSPAYRQRVVRTKAYVTQEATKLSAELFALSGGRHYRRTSPIARALADSFAGTALRPPLALALDMLVENFEGVE